MTTFAITIAVIVALFFALQMWIRLKARKTVGKPLPTDVSRDEFFSGKNKKLLYFYSPSCGACKQMTPEIEALRKKAPDQVRSVNIAESMVLSQAIGIMATPTTVIVRDKMVLDVKIGSLSRKKMNLLIGLS